MALTCAMISAKPPFSSWPKICLVDLQEVLSIEEAVVCVMS